MRFEKLYLKAFGPFTDFTMDFSDGSKDLHIIYGLNEAGKSSLLRGILATLFGIPERTNDNFLHENSKLRIGAKLSGSDGKTLSFLLRKGKKNIFFDLNGNLLDDHILRSFCTLPEQSLFQNIFGLNHRTLFEGGQDILSGGGNLGESLFEAGSGTVGLRKKLNHIEAELARLFKPQGTNPVINQAIKKLNDARHLQKGLILKGEAWVRTTREHEKLHQKIAEIREDLRELQSQKERLQQIQTNLPLIAKRKSFDQELVQLSNVPDLPDSAPDERKTFLRDLHDAKVDLKHAREKVKELRNQLANIHIPSRILDFSDKIEGLHQGLGSYRDAAGDLPQREAEFNNDLSRAKDKLQEIKPEFPFDQIERLRLQPSEVSRIRSLITNYEVLKNKKADVEEEISSITEDLNQKEKEITKCPQETNLDRLRAAVDSVKALGNLEERYKLESKKAEDIKNELSVNVSALGLRTNSIEEFKALPIPLQETVTKFEQIWFDLENKKMSLAQQSADAANRRKQLIAEQNKIAATGEIATLAQLKEVRDWRNKGWDLMKKAYIEKKLDPQEARNQFDKNHELHEAFELAVSKSDHISDLLRANSERAGQYQSLSAQLDQLDQGNVSLKETQKLLDQKSQNYDKTWASIWNPINLKPLTPKEMNAWLQKHKRVLDRIGQLQDCESNVNSLFSNISEAWETLRDALTDSALPSAVDKESLKVLLTRCENLLDSISKDNEKTKTLREQLSNCQLKLDKAQIKLNNVHKELNKWETAWESAIARLEFEASASPADVETFLENLEYLFKAFDKATSLHARIEGMKTRIATYKEDVESLLCEIASDLSDADPKDAIENLYHRYKAANQDNQKKGNFEDQIGDYQTQEDEANRKIRTSQDKLTHLCKQADCESIEDLPEIENKSLRKKFSTEKIREIDEQLIEQNHDSIDNILRTSDGADSVDIRNKITKLEETISSLENDNSEVLTKSGELKAALQSMDGNQKAADALQTVEEKRAQIQESVENYIRLLLSKEVLRQAIEDYRQQHQGPLLTRAGNFFHMITESSFSSLRQGFDGNDNPILLGVRNTGKELTVDKMSDGTVDQLFLALRLAAIERYMELSEPIPLILDDLLVLFDDPRSEATLKVLNMISKKTQVLFLTHHSHLVSFAQKVLPPNSFQIHNLSV